MHKFTQLDPMKYPGLPQNPTGYNPANYDPFGNQQTPGAVQFAQPTVPPVAQPELPATAPAQAPAQPA